ncbi:MAG: condensation domain-containing protein, partial [Chloroflexota bacterium]
MISNGKGAASPAQPNQEENKPGQNGLKNGRHASQNGSQDYNQNGASVQSPTLDLSSLSTRKFIAHVQRLGIKLWVEEGALKYKSPPGRFTDAIRSELIARKPDVIKFLGRLVQNQPTQASEIQPISRSKALPLSYAQQRLWFLDQLDGADAAYNVWKVLQIKGTLNVSALEQAISEIVRRHETLRTTFSIHDGDPVQVIAPAQGVTIPTETIQPNKSEQEVWLAQRILAEVEEPFDLANGPVFRARLLVSAPGEQMLVLVFHHIVYDDWSDAIFMQELVALYQAYASGQPSPLEEVSIQYADFAAWQRTWLSGERLQNQLGYWKEQLTGTSDLLELPTDRPRPPIQTFRGRSVDFFLDAQLAQTLNELSKQQGTTLFMTLLAAFNVLLARYSRQSDIVVGTPIANRSRRETEAMIGFFINTLVMRSDLSGNPTFLEHLAQVRQTAIDAYAHQDVPFEQVVEAVDPARSMSHTPLFQVMFAVQTTTYEGKGWFAEMEEALAKEDLTLTPLGEEDIFGGEAESMTAKFDMDVTLGDTGNGIAGSCEFNADLFDLTTMESFFRRFEQFLQAIADNPDVPVKQVSLLSQEELDQQLMEWTQTNRDYPLDTAFHRLLEAQVERTPDAVAMVCGVEQVTYAELNQQANALARKLQEEGVSEDVVVAILADRSIEFAVAVLAVWKAGGAYLPLDPHHPVERIQRVLTQSASPLVLATEEFAQTVRDASSTLDAAPTLWLLDQVLADLTPDPENLAVDGSPDALAYVIFTSGSTGMPKGAMVEMRGMVNHLYAKVEDLALTPNDKIVQNAPQCFDISLWQFWSALLAGGTTYVYPDEIAHDPQVLVTQTAEDEITVL